MKMKHIFALSILAFSLSVYAQDEDPNSFIQFPEGNREIQITTACYKLTSKGERVRVDANTDAVVDRNGKLLRGVLGEDTLLRPVALDVQIKFRKGSQITFDSEGKVTGGILCDNYRHKTTKYGGGVIFKGGTQIWFYPEGNVRNGFLLKNTDLSVRGSRRMISFAAGTQVFFTPVMDVERGYSAKLQNLQAVKPDGSKVTLEYAEGSPLKFDEQGDVTIPPPRKKRIIKKS